MKYLTKKDIFDTLEKHNADLKKYEVKKIGLFGSFARGKQTKKSDIDFLVEFKNPTFDNFMDLVFYLEKLFSMHVDLVTDKGLSPYMRPYIEKEVKWYEAQ